MTYCCNAMTGNDFGVVTLPGGMRSVFAKTGDRYEPIGLVAKLSTVRWRTEDGREWPSLDAACRALKEVRNG